MSSRAAPLGLACGHEGYLLESTAVGNEQLLDSHAREQQCCAQERSACGWKHVAL
jgi:hypothetical protein